MSGHIFKINAKTVQLSQPYVAARNEMIGREREMKKLLAAWMGGGDMMPLSPLLVGEPGLGKNRIVYESTRMCSKGLYIVQGHEDVTAEDLVCSVRFSDDPDKKMDYIASPLLTAMIKGSVCFLDEIAKMRPRALAALASVLDERRYIDSVLLGERVYAEPGFRFVAATNTADLEQAALPDFVKSRLRPVINVGYPEREEIEGILRARFETVRVDSRHRLLDRFWKFWADRHGDRLPTPRDSLYIFAFAVNVADFGDLTASDVYDLEKRPALSTVTDEHLESAFEAFHSGLEVAP